MIVSEQDLTLTDILRIHGFDNEQPTRLVRHQDKRYPVAELLREGCLDLYQSYQSKPRFHRVKQIVSFYGLSGSRACLYGVFRVLGWIRWQRARCCPLARVRWIGVENPSISIIYSATSVLIIFEIGSLLTGDLLRYLGFNNFATRLFSKSFQLDERSPPSKTIWSSASSSASSRDCSKPSTLIGIGRLR